MFFSTTHLSENRGASTAMQDSHGALTGNRQRLLHALGYIVDIRRPSGFGRICQRGRLALLAVRSKQLRLLCRVICGKRATSMTPSPRPQCRTASMRLYTHTSCVRGDVSDNCLYSILLCRNPTVASASCTLHQVTAVKNSSSTCLVGDMSSGG